MKMNIFQATHTDFLLSICSIKCVRLETLENKALMLVKEQIQCMNIKGWKDSHFHVCKDAVKKRQLSQMEITDQTEVSNMSEPQISDVTSVSHRNVESDKTLASSEPIYAVVDLSHKYAQRKMRRCCEELNRCKSYESILNNEENYTATLKELQKVNKDIVDDDVDGIYEDGELFADNEIHLAVLEDENIYEPINVTAPSRNAFWKYFTRLKVHSILQFTRLRKSGHADYDTIRMRTPRPPTVSSTITPSTSPRIQAQISNIRQKFGAHRKSMQIRVKKLCTRTKEPKSAYKLQPAYSHQQLQQPTHHHPKLHNNTNSDHYAAVGATSIVKKPKSRWKSVKIRPKPDNSDENVKTGKQRFFDSLPHLPKERISLFSSYHLQSGKDRESKINDIAGTSSVNNAKMSEFNK